MAEQKTHEEPKKTENSKLSNYIIIGLLLAFIILGTYAAVYYLHPGGNEPELPPNFYQCGAAVTRFRANISDCMQVSITPSEKQLTDTILNPTASSVLLLMDPDAPGEVALAVYDVHKMLENVAVPDMVVYTQPWPNQTDVPVMDIDDATYDTPILWFRQNEFKTEIAVDGPKITIYAKDQKALDAAACRIAIAIIEDYYVCE